MMPNPSHYYQDLQKIMGELQEVVTQENFYLANKELGKTLALLKQKESIVQKVIQIQKEFNLKESLEQLTMDEQNRLKETVLIIKEMLEINYEHLQRAYMAHDRFMNICLKAIKDIKTQMHPYTKNGNKARIKPPAESMSINRKL